MRWHPSWSDTWTRLTYPKTFWFLLALTACLVVLSLLVRAKATLRFDLNVTRWLQKHHSPFRSRAADALTWLGNSLTLVLLAVGFFAACLYVGEPTAGLFTFLALLSLPINTLLKSAFDRERPGQEEVKVLPGPRWGFSYPSGHAMGSTALYAFIGFLFWLHVPSAAFRYSALGLFVFLPILIGLSRVYLGAHWLSDVVGGFTGGMVVVVILAALYPV
jgi:membrane-associated phospholipid phosphatase